MRMVGPARRGPGHRVNPWAVRAVVRRSGQRSGWSVSPAPDLTARVAGGCQRRRARSAPAFLLGLAASAHRARLAAGGLDKTVVGAGTTTVGRAVGAGAAALRSAAAGAPPAPGVYLFLGEGTSCSTWARRLSCVAVSASMRTSVRRHHISTGATSSFSGSCERLRRTRRRAWREADLIFCLRPPFNANPGLRSRDPIGVSLGRRSWWSPRARTRRCGSRLNQSPPPSGGCTGAFPMSARGLRPASASRAATGTSPCCACSGRRRVRGPTCPHRSPSRRRRPSRPPWHWRYARASIGCSPGSAPESLTRSSRRPRAAHPSCSQRWPVTGNPLPASSRQVLGACVSAAFGMV